MVLVLVFDLYLILASYFDFKKASVPLSIIIVMSIITIIELILNFNILKLIIASLIGLIYLISKSQLGAADLFTLIFMIIFTPIPYYTLIAVILLILTLITNKIKPNSLMISKANNNIKLIPLITLAYYLALLFSYL